MHRGRSGVPLGRSIWLDLRHRRAGSSVGLILLSILIAACGDQTEPPPSTGSATLDTLVTVSLRGLPIPGPTASVAVTADLERIALASRDAGEIFLFDGQGQLVRRFGRSGEGPGEFLEISHLTFHPASDSLWVLDRGNGRVSVVGPEDSRPSREITLPGRYYGAAWASDTLLMVQGRFADGAGESALGRGIYAGEAVPALFEDAESGMDAMGTSRRPVTSAASGGLWVGHFREPTLRRLDRALQVTDTLEYEADFFGVTPENAEPWSGMIDTEPAVLGLTEGPAGDLWILFGVPADPLPDVENPGRALAEGRVETADLARAVLASFDQAAPSDGPSAELDPFPLQTGLLPGGIAYRFDADELGEIVLTVMRVGS